MKKHRLWYIVATLFLLGFCLWCWGYYYTSSATIPSRVRLSEWDLSGQAITTFRQQLNEHIRQVERTPIYFTFGNSGVKPVTTTLSKIGIHYHANSLLNALQQLENGTRLERMLARWTFPTAWNLEFIWKQSQWKKQFPPRWEVQTFGEPVNAIRNITATDEINYQREKNVYRIERGQLEQLIRSALPHRWQTGQTIAIDVPLIVNKPAVTIASLQAEGIERKIITFSTKFVQATDGRTHNIVSVAKTLNNVLLKPNEIFDYDRVIAQTEQTYGFREAPVIYNGKFVSGTAGGVCQVSSTLYNAVLRTGLQIVERRNHSRPVSYLPLGLDATFSEGYINFKFKNTTGKHLLIRTATKHNRLQVTFFGTMDKRVAYRIKTQTVKVIEPAIQYVKSNHLSGGERQTIQRGQKGYIVESYRLKFINGKQIACQRLAIDNYKSQPIVIAIPAETVPE